MPDTAELDQLVSEYTQMDVAAQPERAKFLLQRAAALVDRSAAPLKWAALRSRFGDLAEHDDPPAAIAAYRDALAVWDAVAQHDLWVHCHLQLGCLLSPAPPGSAEAEQALVHLEHAVADNPYLARLLAALYGFRPLGDPADNWRKRMAYLAMAVAQTSPASDLVAWAKVSNELASAQPEEPAGDFAAAMEQRIAGHQQVLAALQAAGTAPDAAAAAALNAVRVDTWLQLATAYLDRVQGQAADNGRLADALVQQALEACGDADGDEPGVKGGETGGKGTGAQPSAIDPGTPVQLLLLRARCLIFKQGQASPANVQAGLDVLAKARALAAHRPQPELRASVEKLDALAYLVLLRLGQHQHLAAFEACCAAALALFAGPSFGDERRKLLQIQADGLLAVGQYAAAGDCCAGAIALAEAALGQAVSTPGRLERIWALRDSAGLLAYCRALSGDLPAAIDALETGKARLWGPAPSGPASARVAGLIPPGGALLLPVLAGPEGLVIIATAGTAGTAAPVFTRVDLPRFGQARVLALQRGPDPAALGGWLQAYCFRRSAPERFLAEIDTLAQVLGQDFWAPVLGKLASLGVAPGAELLLLPQGASASLPLQAACWGGQGPPDAPLVWLTERHALRFAPSLGTLGTLARSGLAGAGTAGGGAFCIVAANPAGDLVFDAFEVTWIQAAYPQAQVLRGPQATPGQVLAALHASQQVHIATHAEFDLDDPLASRIRLAGGDLTVSQLVAHLAQGRPDFMALSACETGVTRVTSLADEFLGFPAALLAAGVHTVLATQWSVDDAASALLMGQFYRERVAAAQRSDGSASAAQCLRRAQQWLRTLTVAAFAKLLRPLRDLPGQAGEVASALNAGLRGRDDAECLYAHPYFWAGFCVVGDA